MELFFYFFFVDLFLDVDFLFVAFILILPDLVTLILAFPFLTAINKIMIITMIKTTATTIISILFYSKNLSKSNVSAGGT